MDTTDAPMAARPPSRFIATLAFARREWVWFVICALFTGAIIQYSFMHGRLAAPPFFDDVQYFDDALERLRDFYRSGFVTLAYGLVRHPPHSYFSTLLALIVYLIFGTAEWAPYVANIVIVLAMAGLVNVIARGLALWQRLMLFVFVLTIPISSRAVFEFRPDIASALCTAGGAMLLILKPPARSSWKERAAAGALFGLAMFIKTPTFPLTLAMMIAALAISSWADLRGSPRQVFRSAAQCFVIALLVASPAYITHFREVLEYIWAPTYGSKREAWRTPGPMLEHLRFYFDGPGGAAMLGRHLYVVLTIVLAGFLVAAALRLWGFLAKLIACIFIAAVAYVIPTILSVKQEFFGTSFDWMLVFTSIYLLVILCRHANWIVAGTVLGLALAAGLALAQFPPPLYEAASPLAAARRRLVNELATALHDQGLAPNARIYVTTTGYVNGDVLNFVLLQRGLAPFRFEQRPGIDDLAVHRRQIQHAACVIASEQGNSDAMGGFLKAGNIQDQTLALVRQDPAFDEVGSFPTLNGKRYFLFHRGRFAGFEAVSGLGPIEGPFPQWGLGRVRWGFGPRTTLSVTMPSDGKYVLLTDGRAAVAGEKMSLRVDNRPAGDYRFSSNDRFENAKFEFDLQAGRHQLQLDYSDWDHAGRQSRAMLFDLLKVRRKE